jgi:Uri superfamily endonuclease
MINYQKGKIYKLINNITDEILYIGSTCKTLNARLKRHKLFANNDHQSPIYIKMREIGTDNINIILVQDYPCNTKRELLQQETNHIKLYNNLINKTIPLLSPNEKINYNKKSNKIWYEKNKHKRNTKITCECGSIINDYSTHKNRHLKSKKHINYLTNQPNRTKAIKKICECGGKYIDNNSNKTIHFNTKKHQKFEKSKLMI